MTVILRSSHVLLMITLFPSEFQAHCNITNNYNLLCSSVFLQLQYAAAPSNELKVLLKVLLQLLVSNMLMFCSSKLLVIFYSSIYLVMFYSSIYIYIWSYSIVVYIW